jgi:hypothetical protein
MLSIPLPTETIVVDENHTQLFKFEGLFNSPVGARIHIDNGVGGVDVPRDQD